MRRIQIRFDAGWVEQIANGLRHPFILLIIGSVLGSFLIPKISSITNKNHLLQEARLKKAIETVHNATLVDSQLNVIRSRLGEFHRDNIHLRPALNELQQKQDKLREDIKDRYSEFDKFAWWWHKDLLQEAIILEIIPPGDSTTQLSNDLKEYDKNIVDTVNALFKFRDKCISRDYDFEENGDVTKTKKQMDNELEVLNTKRKALVSKIVEDLTLRQGASNNSVGQALGDSTPRL